MKFIQSTLIISVLLFSISSCKNPEQLQEDPPTPMVEKEVAMATLVTDFRAYGNSAATGISDVTITGNQMSMNVKYTGGCNEHVFQLIGHRMISKSTPPQRNIRLYHDSGNDDCRQVIEEKLVFDIRSFAGNEPEITLLLDGYGEKITYRKTP